MNSIAKGNVVRATVYCNELAARHDARKARSTVQTAKVTKRVVRADCAHVTVWVVTVREAEKKNLYSGHYLRRRVMQ
jgi:hypothetical protein